MSGFETRAIHEGQEPDPTSGAVIPPISISTTFVQDGVGNMRAGYDYARAGNPTRTSLEVAIASLEGAKHGHAFSSGQAAEDAILRQLPPNSHIIIANDAYGGTYRIIAKVHAPHGLEFTPVDFNDPDALDNAWRDNTRMVMVETPTNPLLSILDISSIAGFAHDRGALCAIDNTFASPYLQQPLGLGADISFHSTTKYLGGHSDVTGGFVALNDDELSEKLYFHQKAVGAVPGPFDCYMTQRGIKTLAVRMERHCENAKTIAEMLVEHDAVETVYYPGLADHPNHDIATKQMRDYGGMVSFTLKGGQDAALKVAEKTKLFALAESLGGVESLLDHPGLMTHASAAGSPLEVSPALLRLSVGIETIDDLLADLSNALARQ